MFGNNGYSNDVKLDVRDFKEAVDLFRKTVAQFKDAVVMLDESLAAEMEMRNGIQSNKSTVRPVQRVEEASANSDESLQRGRQKTSDGESGFVFTGFGSVQRQPADDVYSAGESASEVRPPKS
jgi:hypothetical protein